MCSLRYRRSIPLFLKRRHKVTRIALVTQNYLSSIPCGILHRSKSIFPLAGKGIFLVRSFILSFVSWIKETKEKQQQKKKSESVHRCSITELLRTLWWVRPFQGSRVTHVLFHATLACPALNSFPTLFGFRGQESWIVFCSPWVTKTEFLITI